MICIILFQCVQLAAGCPPNGPTATDAPPPARAQPAEAPARSNQQLVLSSRRKSSYPATAIYI